MTIVDSTDQKHRNINGQKGVTHNKGTESIPYAAK